MELVTDLRDKQTEAELYDLADRLEVALADHQDANQIERVLESISNLVGTGKDGGRRAAAPAAINNVNRKAGMVRLKIKLENWQVAGDFQMSVRLPVGSSIGNVLDCVARHQKLRREWLLIFYNDDMLADDETLEQIGCTEDDETLYVYVNRATIDDDVVEVQAAAEAPRAREEARQPDRAAMPARNNDTKNPTIEAAAAKGNGEYWVCQKCTFHNFHNGANCEVCATDNFEDVVQQPMPGPALTPKPKPKPIQEPAPKPKPIQEPRRDDTIGAGQAQHRADQPPAAAVAFWECALCTFRNLPLRPGCEVCGTERPEDYEIPANYTPSEDELKWAQDNEFEVMAVPEVLAAASADAGARGNLLRNDLLRADDLPLLFNDNEFECCICYTSIEPGQGARLHSCLHEFCLDCLRGHIAACQDAMVLCPFANDAYKCDEPISDREIEVLVGQEAFEKFKQRGLQLVEAAAAVNAFHCKTVNCKGWCFVEERVNVFNCPVCKAVNCLQCKVIHAGKNCREYQDDLRARADNDADARATQEFLDKEIRDGNAMRCPQCKIVVMKKVGCDWLQCLMCKCEICWVTKGPRWGPKGYGDTSGGCRCRLGGKLCALNCGNCH